MKVKLSLSFTAGLLAVGVLAATSFASISGSAHDFGTFGWSGNQICLPCHTPHNSQLKDAQGYLLGGPLWNHTLSTATYTMQQVYSTDSSGNIIIDPVSGKPVTVGVAGTVDQNSKLCLSCHDGTVALDSFANINGASQTGTNYISNAKYVFGTDLSNDHPLGSGGVYPGATSTDGKTFTGTASYMVDPTLRATAGIMPLQQMPGTSQWVVACTSCHEPHNRPNQQHLLWVNNSGAATTVDGRSVSGSLLCMNCHKK